MMMTGAPIKLTQADAADVADLYNRCSDYFLLQDGAAPTLDDARELFSDVPPEKSAHNQAVLGWKGPGGLYAIAAILRDYPRDGTWYLGFMIVDAAQRGPCTLSGHGFTVAARQRSFRQVPPRCRHYGHVSASLNGDAIRSSANGDQSAGRQASRG